MNRPEVKKTFTQERVPQHSPVGFFIGATGCRIDRTGDRNSTDPISGGESGVTPQLPKQDCERLLFVGELTDLFELGECFTGGSKRTGR